MGDKNYYEKNMNDNYNPFKAAVEAIMEMCEKYGSFETISEDSRVRANDFLNNVRVKCKDAFEYDNMFPTTNQLEKLVNTSYENGYKQCKEDMMKNAINAEIIEVEDVSYSMNAHTHLEIFTDEDLEKNYKDGDKLSLIILKKE